MRSLIGRRRPATPPRRDPAPSRWAYRMQRLWLTPLFRRLLRLGLPTFALTFAAGLYLADEDRRTGLTETFDTLRQEVKNRPEFMVTLLSVEGASPALAETVRVALSLPLPQSSLDLDLLDARSRVEALDAVAAVGLRIQPGGVLQVSVTEREPAVVWRAPEGLILLDATGHRIAGLMSRGERPDLPLIVGEGADKAVPEALDLIMASGPFLSRLRGLARMSERRWDLVLDRDQRILLPADDPLTALDRFIALDATHAVLMRDVAAVDLRMAERPVLRLTPYALADLRRKRGILPPEADL